MVVGREASIDVASLMTRLRSLRKSRRVSMESVAREAGYKDRQTVHAWESGTSMPPLRALEAYEAACGVPIDMIVGGKHDPRATLDPSRIEMAESFLRVLASAPDDDVENIRALLHLILRNYPQDDSGA